jgi:uncharacterized membrane protein YkoI
MTTVGATQQLRSQSISCDQALKIAQADAAGVYGDLSDYRITVFLGPEGWHVDYELAQLGVAGGGPHYVIDSETGRILSKRYEQ